MREPERAVLIVDDHRSFAEALAIAIDAQEGLRCAAVAASAAEGLAAASLVSPDLAIVDMQLPDMAGAILVERLRDRRPDLAVLALTAFVDAASVLAASQAGVGAFLSKTCTVREIVATLRTVGTGAMMVGAEVLIAGLAGHAVAAPAHAARSSVHLTPRERQVLDLLGDAADVRAVAKQLGISIHTVRDHVKSLLAKFDVHTQLELVVRARQLGLLGDGSPTPPEPLPAQMPPAWSLPVGAGPGDVRYSVA
jgi:DNA-binding NarL/FixJ family response regulator